MATTELPTVFIPHDIADRKAAEYARDEMLSALHDLDVTTDMSDARYYDGRVDAMHEVLWALGARVTWPKA
jgi:hypothetical protein